MSINTETSYFEKIEVMSTTRIRATRKQKKKAVIISKKPKKLGFCLERS